MKCYVVQERQKNVFEEVSYLYKNSRRSIAHWFWDHHVKVVAQKAIILAEKYNASVDFVFVGALLHDLADVWMERTDVLFESKSRLKAEKILRKAGYQHKEIDTIITQIIEPHSCRLSHLPQILEGKILASADALTHLQTDFYQSLKKMGLPENVLPGNFDEWALGKIEHDFNNKIFFDDEMEQVRKDYERLKELFSRIGLTLPADGQ